MARLPIALLAIAMMAACSGCASWEDRDEVTKSDEPQETPSTGDPLARHGVEALSNRVNSGNHVTAPQ